MTDALLVNPHSAEELSDALRKALAMSLEERQRRWRSLMDGVQEQDVTWWLQRFTDELAGVPLDTATPQKEMLLSDNALPK